MGAITDRAQEIAAALRVAAGPGVEEIRATVDVRNAVPPCILVVPVPYRTYNVGGTLTGGFEVRWTLVAIASGQGDYDAARVLEELVDHVATVVDVDTAEPGSYQTPGAEAPSPAYIITVTELAEA